MAEYSNSNAIAPNKVADELQDFDEVLQSEWFLPEISVNYGGTKWKYDEKRFHGSGTTDD
jgi:hypothetical protein